MMSYVSRRLGLRVSYAAGVCFATFCLTSCDTNSGNEELQPESSSTGAVVAVDVTLAPDGAYPVLTPAEAKRADLSPGTYRIRLDYQADWPERCLDEMIVFPSGQQAPGVPEVMSSISLPADWEQQAIEEQNAIRELREPICSAFR